MARGAAIYVCGSLQGMAGGVHVALGEIVGADALEQLTVGGRYRRDIY
jgi:sulfite reductase (NADPH) flavoprotein alpha-component